jgi:hypothetical protein
VWRTLHFKTSWTKYVMNFSRFLTFLAINFINDILSSQFFSINLILIHTNCVQIIAISSRWWLEHVPINIVFICQLSTLGVTGQLFMFWQRKRVNQSHYRPGQALRFQEAEASRFHDNWHMKEVRLSALSTSCLYPPGNISDIHFS